MLGNDFGWALHYTFQLCWTQQTLHGKRSREGQERFRALIAQGRIIAINGPSNVKKLKGPCIMIHVTFDVLVWELLFRKPLLAEICLWLVHIILTDYLLAGVSISSWH